MKRGFIMSEDRTDTTGMRNNPYWYSANPYFLTNRGLPNNQCYVWGRFWETSAVDGAFSNRPKLITTLPSNQWYNLQPGGYARRTTPFGSDQYDWSLPTGTIACYNSSSGGRLCCKEYSVYRNDLTPHRQFFACSEFTENGFNLIYVEMGTGKLFSNAEYPDTPVELTGYTFQGYIIPDHYGAEVSNPSQWGLGKKIFKVNRGL